MAITKTVNQFDEFKIAWKPNGELVVWDEMIPSYTIFHKDDETFSNLWTVVTGVAEQFCADYEEDLARYGDIHQLHAKLDAPENTFPISMIPWVSFEGFNLNLQKGYSYLSPIFTMGKASDNKMPLVIQVHYAVCDGYHLAQFIKTPQEHINH